jgi:hypothetical protein
MHLINVLQADGNFQTVLFNTPEVYAKETVGTSIWYFKLTNTEIEEVCIGEAAYSLTVFPARNADGSLNRMYETLSANYYKGHYKVVPMSEFMGVKTSLKIIMDML